MDDRRTPDRTWRRGALLAGALLAVMAMALGACGGSGSEGAGNVDISDLDDPAAPTGAEDSDATTTTADDSDATTRNADDSDATTTTADAGDGGEGTDSGDTDCGLLAEYLLTPAQLSEEDGGAPLPELLSMEEELAAMASIGEELPPELETRWGDLMAAAEAEAAGEVISYADGARLFTVYDEAIVWAAQNCPDAPPAWSCATQAKFEQVGEAIGGDTSSLEEEGAQNPEEILAGYGDAEEAVVLDESETAVLWGWLDEDGLVVRSEQASKVDGGWFADGSLSCYDEASTGDSESFEPVGEPIPTD